MLGLNLTHIKAYICHYKPIVPAGVSKTTLPGPFSVTYYGIRQVSGAPRGPLAHGKHPALKGVMAFTALLFALSVNAVMQEVC